MSDLKNEWQDGIVIKFFKMLKRNWKILLGIIVGMGVISVIANFLLDV